MTAQTQEKILERAQQLHGEAQELEERIGFIEQQIVELRDFEKGLHTLETSEHKEILASLGKGVFIPGKIEKKELLVDVGAGVIVKKNVPEVIKVIHDQLERMEGIRSEAQENLINLQSEFKELFEELNSIKE